MKTLHTIIDSIEWFLENHPYWTIVIFVLVIMLGITIDAIANAPTYPDDHPEVTYDEKHDYDITKEE